MSSFRLQQSFRDPEESVQRSGSIFDSKMFSEFSVLDDPADAVGTAEADERLNLGTQVGRNISRVRWIGHSDTYIPDALATEYFIVGTYADSVSFQTFYIEGYLIILDFSTWAVVIIFFAE